MRERYEHSYTLGDNKIHPEYTKQNIKEAFEYACLCAKKRLNK